MYYGRAADKTLQNKYKSYYWKLR